MQQTTERPIASGSYGNIFVDVWKNMPEEIRTRSHLPETMPVAIKKPSQHPRSKELLRREIAIHRQLSHPNIVTFLGAFLGEFDASPWGLIMELVSGVDLIDMLIAHKEPLSTILQLSIARDIALGLNYLHDLKIIHRDLKCENVLIERRGESILAKICDFGLAASLEERPFTKFVGSLPYVAPELLRPQGPYSFSLKSDIYAFAIILWMLASKHYPFEKLKHISNDELFQLVSSGHRDTIPPHTHVDFGKLITDCWEQNPEHRPLSLDIIARVTEKLTLNSDLLHLAKNTGDLSDTGKTDAAQSLITFGLFAKPADEPTSLQSPAVNAPNKKYNVELARKALGTPS